KDTQAAICGASEGHELWYLNAFASKDLFHARFAKLTDLHARGQQFLKAWNDFCVYVGPAALRQGTCQDIVPGGSHANHNFFHGISAHEFRKILAVSDNRRVADDASDFAWVIVDETYDFIRPSCFEFSMQHDAGASGAVEKHAL